VWIEKRHAIVPFSIRRPQRLADLLADAPLSASELAHTTDTHELSL